MLLLNGQKLVNQNDIILIFTYIAPENFLVIQLCLFYQSTQMFICFCQVIFMPEDYMDFIVEDDTEYVFGEHTAYPADTFSMPRNNKDCDFSNAYSVSVVKLRSAFNVHILNGCLFDDQDGNYICSANNSSSVVDYMIASTTLFPTFINFGITDFDISDHMPLNCTLKMDEKSHLLNNDTLNPTRRGETYAWETISGISNATIYS